MLTKIIIYGKLRKLLGRKQFEAKLNSAKQVFSFLSVNYPQVSEKILRMTYAIKVNDKYINNIQMENPIGNKILRLIPIATGSSSSFSFDTPIGGSSFEEYSSYGNQYEINYSYTPSQMDFSYTYSVGSSPSPSSVSPSNQGFNFGQAITDIATSYALSYLDNQVQNFLNPQPKPTDTSNSSAAAKDKSFNASFNGISNTINAGVAVPICLGEAYTGSIVISAALDTAQLTGKGKDS